jgi:uncharacterized RDD family membrane protein YckC
VPLYDHLVCRGCQRDFALRRALAYLLDNAAFGAAAFAAHAVLAPHDPAAAKAAFLVLGWVAFAFRDAHRGRSPGKALFDLHVVADGTREPIGPLHSLARNAILFVPLMPLVAATQAGQGKRIGDGMAGTRVVWTRHARSRVFS